MYVEHFGLSSRPFAITPDPRYLFLSARHRDALAHLLYGVTESGGFIQLTGEVGTGKTTLTRTLLTQLPPNVDAALLVNPRATLVEFLESICDELGVEVGAVLPVGAVLRTASSDERGAQRHAHDAHRHEHTPKRLTDALNRHLVDAHARGRRTVLIIDEAQNLDRDLLEQVRLLTNLETHTDKLLQILLIGQPELRAMLARPDLRQLAQRITARYHLDPLDAAETAAYVRHRLEVAGARRALFTPAALRALHRASGGVPRLINIICDRALLGAYAEGAQQVDAALLRHAAREVRGDDAPRPRLAVLSLALAGALVVGGWHFIPKTLGTDRPVEVGERVALPEAVSDPPPLPVTADAPDTHDIDPPDLATTTTELLARWSVPPVDGLPGTLCDAATQAGLACARGRGTWNNLRVLNRPALLELRIDGATQTLLLVGLGDAHARVWTPVGEHTLPLLELDRAWHGEYLLLWRPPLPPGTVLAAGASGDAVRWLRGALAHWREPDGPAHDDDVYDDALTATVRDFQHAFAIEVDGVVGEQTLLHLDALTRPGGPTLDVIDP